MTSWLRRSYPRRHAVPRLVTSCLDANEVVRFLDGDVTPDAAAAFEDHVDRCAECRALVTELGRALDVEEAADTAGGSDEDDWQARSGAELVERGARVGRYVVLDAIGAGAMGIVYRAYDPELDRDVALKLVRVLGDERGRDRARERVVREAQAMAKLAHPNVVAVYDASTYGAHVFVAMELVDGTNLEMWLTAAPRSWRAIAMVFRDAARGLAAAHAAGIVHRDFKPANVLVGKDGRARVSDFGLATTAQETRAELVGTPAYMSPEVRAGAAADASSDQYSFAVALREALGTSPRRLRSVFRRAQASEPSARFTSMDDVGRALDRALASRARWLVPAAALVIVIGGASVYMLAAAHAESCTPPRDRLAGIWDAPRRSAIERAFIASGDPRARETWTIVDGNLERATSSWLASHVRACVATHVRHEQSSELLDRRIACLDSELARISALTDALATADRALVTRAAGASEIADRIARCNDISALRDAASLPSDPIIRVRAAAATAELARIEALSLRGRYAFAIEQVAHVIDEATAIGDARLEADALRSLGESQWRAGRIAEAIPNLYRAIDAAKRAHAADLEAGALLTLVAVLGYEDARYAEALQVARLAESTIRASGDTARLGKLLGNRGAIYYARADFAAARADYAQAAALLERAYGPDDRRVGQALMNIAMVEAELNDGPSALEHYRRALDILERKLGARHPEVALALANRAIALANLGRHADAMRDLERALAIRREVLGPDHRDVIGTESVMGEVELEHGNAAAAAAHFHATVVGYQRTLRADHPLLASAYSGEGRALVAAERWREARESLEHALAIWDPLHLDGPMQASTRFALARALWQSGGDKARARRLAAAAEPAAATNPGLQAEIKTWREAHR